MKPALMILTADIGSQYGGLKQLDRFTQEEYIIIDFSIYDNVEEGFGKFMVIIRKNIKDDS